MRLIENSEQPEMDTASLLVKHLLNSDVDLTPEIASAIDRHGHSPAFLRRLQQVMRSHPKFKPKIAPATGDAPENVEYQDPRHAQMFANLDNLIDLSGQAERKHGQLVTALFVQDKLRSMGVAKDSVQQLLRARDWPKSRKLALRNPDAVVGVFLKNQQAPLLFDEPVF